MLCLIGIVGLQPRAGIPTAANGDARRLEQHFRSRCQIRKQSTLPFWQELGSEELNRVIELALAQNLDLEAALYRIAQARAQAKVAGSALYPQWMQRRRIAELPGIE